MRAVVGVCWFIWRCPLCDSHVKVHQTERQRLRLNTQCLEESKLRNTTEKAYHGSPVIVGRTSMRPDAQACDEVDVELHHFEHKGVAKERSTRHVS